MNNLKKIILILYYFYFISCAAVQAPPGGPKDETPPEIVEIIPPDGSINFKDDKIEIIFSEYIEESSIVNSIQIFPKPINPITLILKNPNLILELNDSLINDQTYIVSINRNLIDEHKVKIKQGLQFAFSTGNKIDKGIIEGEVYHSKIAAVELWKLNQDDNNQNFYKRGPDYIVDASDNGEFKFNFLSNGDYKIIAVDKVISGLPIIDNKMTYGLSNIETVAITNKDSLKYIKIKIPETREGLKMNKAEIISGGWGKIMFSKNIENWDKSLSVSIYDSDSLLLQPEIFKDPIEDNILNFYLKSGYYDYINVIAIKNKDKNLIKVDSSQIRLKIKDSVDSTYLSIISPKTGFTHYIEADSILPLKIIFSSLVFNNVFKNGISLKKDSLNIPIEINWDSYLSVMIKPKVNWVENAQYELSISNNFVTPVYGKILKDSIMYINFKASKYKRFGNLIGNIDGGLKNKKIVELFSFDNKQKLQTNVNLDGSFRILKVPEGNYFLNIFLDINENNIYDYGLLDPFSPAEWFYTSFDTIKIRGNWDLEMKNIKIN